MKIAASLKFVTFLCIVSILFGHLLWALPASADDGGQSDSKVSGLLSLRIQAKWQQIEQSNNLQQASGPTAPVDILAGDDPADIYFEQVFLHFTAQPSDQQASSLASIGVTIYPDSWVPPVGDFQSGFILADMPVNRLEILAAQDFILKINTAETTLSPQNDLARATTEVGPVWTGGNSGAGVRVAVLDSGIDRSNPDFPALNPTNSKDFSGYPVLDDTLANTVTGHGTHVAGSVLGRGVNGPLYQGMAPAADLIFLKIGRDSDSRATHAAIIGAILAAVEVYQADIITMSYGGWSDAHDGSDEKCQAVDYAVSCGVTVFMSAGNNASYGWHYSGTAPANGETDFIRVNVSAARDNNTALYYDLVWFDGFGIHNDLDLQYFDSSQNPLGNISSDIQVESPRGTENVYSCHDFYLPQGNGAYYLKVKNNSLNSQFFHIYYVWGTTAVTFANADPNYTLGSPAEASGAIAVGAYVTRTVWKDYLDNDQTNVTFQTLGSIATFSSLGPRVDGGAPGKPEIVAPGSRIISVRDNDVYPWPLYNTSADIYPYSKYIVDDDGLNLNGSGPANYLIMHGTSMACPVAAGVGALILSAHPGYTPAQVRAALKQTAIDKGPSGFDTTYGWGLINANTAVNWVAPRPVGVGGEVVAVDRLSLLGGWLAVLAIPAGLIGWVIVRKSRRGRDEIKNTK